MFERMTPDQRVEAMAEYRRLHDPVAETGRTTRSRKPVEPRVIKLK
jgi:hypothetical protein